MGKASISIAVTGSYNGSALEKAERRLDSLSKKAVAASGNLDTAGGKLVSSGSKLAKAGGEIYNTGARIEAAGQKLVPVTAAIAGVAVATGAAAVKIDTSLTGVRKTVDGTEEQYRQLKESAIEFSKTNAVSADQILDIQALGAQLGFSIDELDEFSRVVSGLDIATDMNAEQAATELAQFANIVKMSHSDVSRYGSAIVNLGNNLATTESSVSSMGQRIAAASNQVGMSTPDILGWSGAMSSLGIEAEAGGTAFSNTVASIDKAVATGGDALDSFASIAGMSADQFAQSWRTSATDTMLALLKGTNSAENMTVALESMGVTGIRQTDVLKRLAGNTDLVSQALQVSNDGWRENTALQDEVNNRNDSMAAKLEILQNKVTAVAEDIGTPLVNAATDAVDAAEPLFEAVEDVTQGFADMDEGAQRNVIALAAVAAAASPFLTTTGRIVKTVGNTVTAVGKAKQEWGVYADALTTTNASALKTYSSNEKLSEALEKNPAAKAAGGVEKYVEAVRNANSDTSKYNAAVRKLTNEQKKGSKANSELVENLKKEVVEKRNAMNQSNGLVNGYRQEAAAANTSAAATERSAAKMMAGAAAANVLKTAVATLVPAAAIGGLTLLVQSIQDAKKHSDNLKASTTELEAAAAGATNEVKGEAGAFDVLTGSTGSAKADIDKMLESQAQLASTLKETNTSAAAQSAQLTAAYDTIREYANKSDLSTEAQGRLRAAVDTVNSMCGTQISVVDQANGKLADEHGAIDDVTGALGEYVEKKLNQIRVDAQQSNLTALYEQQAQDLQTLAVAQKDYNDEVNRCMKNNPQMTREQAELTMSYSKQGKALDEAKAALGAVNNSIDTVTESLGASVAVADGAAASVKDLAAASPAVSSAFLGLDGDIGQFCDDLQSAGISVEDFKSLNDEQLVQLATVWDGTTGSIIKALGDMGIKCKTQGQAAADNWASGLSAGAQGAIGAAQQVTGSTLEEFKRNCDDYGIAGDAAVTAFANALAQGDTYDVAAAKAREAAGGLDEAKQGGSDAGTLAGALFAEGITTGGAPTEGNAAALAAALTSGISTATADASATGNSAGAGFAQGIADNTPQTSSNAAGLRAALSGGIAPAPGDASSTGKSAGALFASGIGSASGSANANARSLASNAKSGVSSSPGALGGTGSSAGSNYARGVGAAAGASRASGSSLASSASSGASGWSAYTSGSHLGQQFASGIGSAWNSVRSFATSLVNAAKSVMGFSVPEEGPWSGAEKGGETSGRHLGENFAHGMLEARADVRDSAKRLMATAQLDGNVAYTGNGGTKTTVVNNYYSLGDVKIDASSISEFMTLNDFFQTVRKAKAGM